MYKFKMQVLYKEKEFVCTKTELLNFMVTLPLAKLVLVGERLISIGLFFLDDTSIDIQLVILLLLSNVSKLSIRAKTKKN